MRRNTEETERPTEWLRRLQEDDSYYRVLLNDAGSLPVAAYRLARARCRVQSVPALVPTVTELMTAARDLWRRTGPTLPEPNLLLVLEECELQNLPVIRPTPRAA
jgi:hypothetical protein